MADLVYIIRHAEPASGGRGRFWGRADPGVEPDSLARAETLAGLMWEKPARILSSPLRRAALTAERVNRALRLDVERREELAEADFGRFDGLDYSEISSKYPDLAREWAERGDDFSFPEGEAVSAFLARAEREWRFTVDRPEEALAVVTHGGVITAWICLFLGLPWTRRFSFRPAYSALTAFMRKKNGAGWDMIFFNNTV